jgi:hypothetical protein
MLAQMKGCLDHSIALKAGSTGNWTEDEAIKLKDAIQTHGGKNWNAITALVPGRTKGQCYQRRHDILDPNIDRARLETKWTAVEDSKLKDAI